MGATVAFVSSGGDDEPDTREQASTTTLRIEDEAFLRKYCAKPGARWAEVPAYEAAAPSSTHLVFAEEGLDNGYHKDVPGESKRPGPPTSWGGGVALSPATGTMCGQGDAAPVRTVTCISLAATEPSGKVRAFLTGPGAPVVGATPDSADLQLARNRFSVKVFELRTGKVLHQGQIATPAEVRPEQVITEEGQPLGTQVAYGITQHDALAWLSSHFVAGEPA